MSDRHTQGPWHVGMESDWSIDTDGENSFVHIGPNYGDPVAIAVVGSAWDQDDELEANARLIAAAPDLLEALRLALPYVRNDNTASVMRAAIAKATGETK